MQAVALFIFWACVVALVYVYVGYPALLALIAPFVPRTKPKPGYLPTLSVLIAAYNEEANIGKKVEQTLALDYPAEKLEILVLSDGSTDHTDEIIRAFKDPRVRLIRMEPRRGKTAAQNRGVREARGEVLVFSDATTAYHSQALRYLACNYEDPNVGAVSGRYQYFDPEGNSPTGLGTMAFWNYENVLKTLQSRIRTISGCCGCIYSVRKSAYTQLPDDVISDLVQPLWVIQKGFRVAFEDRALAYEETTQSAGEEFSMRVRVITRGIRGLLSVPDILKPWKFGWIAFQLLSQGFEVVWDLPALGEKRVVKVRSLLLEPVLGSIRVRKDRFNPVGGFHVTFFGGIRLPRLSVGSSIFPRNAYQVVIVHDLDPDAAFFHPLLDRVDDHILRAGSDDQRYRIA